MGTAGWQTWPAASVAGLAAAVIVVIAGLHAAAAVLTPLCLAAVLAILVHPLQQIVNRPLARRWHWLGSAAAVAVVAFILATCVLVAAFVLTLVGAGIPAQVDRLGTLLAPWREWAERIGLPLGGGDEGVQTLVTRLAGLGAGLLSDVWTTVGLTVLVLFLLLLMLLEAPRWREKLAAIGAEDGSRWLDTAAMIAAKMRSYLWVQTVVSLINGAAVTLWLLAVGMDHPLLWGLTAFVLNYVPFVGAAVTLLAATLAALLVGGFGQALAVFLGLLAIEQVVSNFLDPHLKGRTLNLSPLAVLVGVVFWGWLWGAVGALLAVPILIVIAVLAAELPSGRPLAMLLSDDPEAVGEVESTPGPPAEPVLERADGA
jgi:AI-2 transport protein TqsA